MNALRAGILVAAATLLLCSLPVHAGKTGKRLLAGVAAVAVVAGDPLERYRDYKPPKQPTHLLESSSGNLTQEVRGAFICFAEPRGGNKPSNKDLAGAVMHIDGRIYYVPMWPYNGGGNAVPARFIVFPADSTEAGMRKTGPALSTSDSTLWDCWSSKEWKWEDHAAPIEGLAGYKSPQQLASERYKADLTAGKVLAGPNNTTEWTRRARAAFQDVATYYPEYQKFWPAYDIFLEKVRNPKQLPNLSGQPFEDYCRNNLDRSNKAKIDSMRVDFGYQLCGPSASNWHKLLAWYHPDQKDYLRASDWSQFGYYNEPQKRIFTRNGAIFNSSSCARPGQSLSLTRVESLLQQKNCSLSGASTSKDWLTGSETGSWYLGDSLITQSYHFLFDYAERANMRVAGIVSGDGDKFASRETFKAFLAQASALIEAALFDSVSNQRDIDTNIREWGLYPELLDFFAATLAKPSSYSDVIEAYKVELLEFEMESAPQREYKYFFGAMALVDACASSRKFFNYRKYIDSNEYNEASSLWRDYANRSPLSSEERVAAEQDVLNEYAATFQYLSEQSSLDFEENTRNFCQENLMTLKFMSSTANTWDQPADPAEPAKEDSACALARNLAAEATTLSELELAKAKVEIVCN